MKKLSPEDKLYCTKRVYFWQKILGIYGWQIFVVFGECEGNSRAEVEFNRQGRVATITFSNEFNNAPWDRSDLDRTAFHEVGEIKYEQYRNFLADDLVDALIHETIRLDENTIFRLLAGCST
jgi:hypothetical protein